jgi:hypothetical protein
MDEINKLRIDCARKQKRGIHFIIASVVIWIGVTIIQYTHLPILTKNLLTFCFTAPLMPIAYLVSKIMKIDFQNKENPLTNLGILFSANQILYLLIAMWVYPTVPDKMLMIIAIIFGAHLLPFSWLYKSRVYMMMSVIIPILALVVGCIFSSYILGTVMIVIELLFCALLGIENKTTCNSRV